MTDEFPVATTPSPGLHGVDWENRVDFGRLRDYRLARVREQLNASSNQDAPSSRTSTTRSPSACSEIAALPTRPVK